MTKPALYPRLALGNLCRSRQVYLPYLLTVAGTVAAFYIVTALASARDLPVMTRYVYLSMFMTVGVFVIAVFAAVFLTYTAGFFMKQRKKELALYNILGLGRSHLARMLLIETVYTAIGGIGGGILLGMLLQKAVTLLLCRIMNTDVWFGFSVSAVAIRHSAVLFSGILGFNLIMQLLQLGRQSPAETLREGSAGEREPRSRPLLALAGIVCLGGGYGIAVMTKNAAMALALYFPAVFLVIFGTYALFSAVSISVLKALRRWKGYYYRPRHFIGVSGMLYRMRRNAVGLANICILSTMVLVMVSGTLSLYLSARITLERQFPGEAAVSVRYDPQADPAFDADAMDARLRRGLDGLGYPAQPVYAYRRLDLTMSQSPGGYTRQYAYTADCLDVYFLTAAETQAVTGSAPAEFAPLTLRFPADQAALNGAEDGRFLTCTVSAAPLGVSAPALGGGFVSAVAPLWLALPDEAALLQVYETQAAAAAALDRTPISLVWQTFYRVEADEEAQASLAERLEAQLDFSGTGSWKRLEIESREETARNYYSINGGFFFLGVFLGLLMMMAAVLILYYKQVAEGYEDRARFRIMQKVGLEPKMVRQSIRSQVLAVFFAPLIMAAVHVAFDFGLMVRLLTMFGLHDTHSTLLCTGGTFLVFAALYAAAFALTARVYEGIVSSGA